MECLFFTFCEIRLNTISAIYFFFLLWGFSWGNTYGRERVERSERAERAERILLRDLYLG